MSRNDEVVVLPGGPVVAEGHVLVVGEEELGICIRVCHSLANVTTHRFVVPLPSSLWPAILQKMQRGLSLDMEAPEPEYINRTSRTGAAVFLLINDRIIVRYGNENVMRSLLTFRF